ncbi:hypothetical protein PQR68_09795 [Paraburkholderia agricolaris]|uniref:hypothetical protein n=1 Tax=Paraburkholderia agricolaris TaxID=2152888 RepID=UPI001292A1CE|nr:hypothetical protein [Paraburkholderia agricolaris]
MKIQFAVKALLVVAFVVVSVIGAWYVAVFYSRLPIEMPQPVDTFVRFVLSVTGNSDMANPDDMAMLALLLYWVVSTLLVGGFIFAGYRALLHYRKQRAA